MDQQPEERAFQEFRKLLKPRMALYKNGNFNEEDIVEMEPLYPSYKSKQTFLSQFPNDRARQTVLQELQSIDRRRKELAKLTAPIFEAVKETILEETYSPNEHNSWEEHLRMRDSEELQKPRPR